MGARPALDIIIPFAKSVKKHDNKKKLNKTLL